jgi:hypothetical protein
MTARQSAEQGTERLRCGSIAPVLRFPRMANWRHCIRLLNRIDIELGEPLRFYMLPKNG